MILEYARSLLRSLRQHRGVSAAPRIDGIEAHVNKIQTAPDRRRPRLETPETVDEIRCREYSEQILRQMSICSDGGRTVSESRRDGVRDLVVRARREQIIGAATRVFARRGFGRATTREVAWEAGVSEGTIYNYFEGKDDLMIAILDGLNETELRSGDFEAGMDTDFRGFLEGYMRRRMALMWENREVFRVVLSEMLVNAELREMYLSRVMEPTMRVAEEGFRSRMERGEVHRTNAPLAMRSVAGAVLGVLVLGLLGDEEIGSRPEEASDVLAGLLLDGLDATEGGRHE